MTASVVESVVMICDDNAGNPEVVVGGVKLVKDVAEFVGVTWRRLGGKFLVNVGLTVTVLEIADVDITPVPR